MVRVDKSGSVADAWPPTSRVSFGAPHNQPHARKRQLNEAPRPFALLRHSVTRGEAALRIRDLLDSRRSSPVCSAWVRR